MNEKRKTCCGDNTFGSVQLIPGRIDVERNVERLVRCTYTQTHSLSLHICPTFIMVFTVNGRTIYLILDSRAINKLPFYLLLSVLMQTEYLI